MIDCHEFYKLLLDQDVNFFTGVPDSLLKNFNAYILDHVPREQHVIAANEGGAIALAAGYHLSTKKIPLVYMQNAGQGNAVNPLVSLTDPEVYSIPMLLLIGWRGEPGTKEEPQHLKQGKITLGLLDILEIPYSILPENIVNVKQTIKEAVTSAAKNSSPYALIVKKETFSRYSSRLPETKKQGLNLEEAMKIVVDNLEKDGIVVSTTGKTSRELFEYREKLGQDHKNDFLTIGSMGYASQIALGIALQKPKKKVYCFDGDGALIMHMGSLAIIGQISQKNLKHIVFNNGAHDSVGGQPTAGLKIDIPKVAEACLYKTVLRAETKEELIKKLGILKSSEGPSLLEIRIIKGTRSDLGRPTKTPIESKKDFMNFLSEK
jgi:phosphonopyruvate decarboxylase